MDLIRFVLKGADRILLNSDRKANTMDPEVKVLKKLTDLKGKLATDDVKEEIGRLKWRLSFYGEPGTDGVQMASRQPWMACVQGASKFKMGSTMKQATIIASPEFIPLTYKGQEEFPTAPDLLDRMWNAGTQFVDVRQVGINGGSRVMAVRPVFAGWGTTLEVLFDPTMISDDQLLTAMTNAGRFYGVGDFRPECSGHFGRFTVQSHEVTKGVA